MIKIGKKSNGLEQGYVWAPYILVESLDVVSSPGFRNASSRYKNPKIEKIKKILEKIEDFEIIS